MSTAIRLMKIQNTASCIQGSDRYKIWDAPGTLGNAMG